MFVVVYRRPFAVSKLIWGAKYVGEYKDNKPNGQGAYTFADSTRYVDKSLSWVIG